MPYINFFDESKTVLYSVVVANKEEAENMATHVFVMDDEVNDWSLTDKPLGTVEEAKKLKPNRWGLTPVSPKDYPYLGTADMDNTFEAFKKKNPNLFKKKSSKKSQTESEADDLLDDPVSSGVGPISCAMSNLNPNRLCKLTKPN